MTYSSVSRPVTESSAADRSPPPPRPRSRHTPAGRVLHAYSALLFLIKTLDSSPLPHPSPPTRDLTRHVGFPALVSESKCYVRMHCQLFVLHVLTVFPTAGPEKRNVAHIACCNKKKKEVKKKFFEVMFTCQEAYINGQRHVTIFIDSIGLTAIIYEPVKLSYWSSGSGILQFPNQKGADSCIYWST